MAKNAYTKAKLTLDIPVKDNLMRLESLYISKLSIEEFCDITGEDITIIKKSCIAKLYGINDSFSDKAMEILSRTPSRAFIYKILNILYVADTKEDFDAIDYYQLTKLKPSDIRNISEEILAKKDQVRIIRKIQEKVIHVNKINKEYELKGARTKNNRLITREEKEEIFKYLENNYLPENLYTCALNKYLKGDLKIYTLKK